jgi:uncharacterized protein YjbJ (UPF0337 family)
MSWLDKLLGRGKKAAGEATGDSSMKAEGMRDQAEAAVSEGAEEAKDTAQEGMDRARDKMDRPESP